MYKKFITPVYIINMVLQALFSLIAPIGLMLGIAYLLVTYAECPSWIYVIFIMLGVFSGLYSMVSFILGASRALEALEKQHREGSASSGTSSGTSSGAKNGTKNTASSSTSATHGIASADESDSAQGGE